MDYVSYIVAGFIGGVISAIIGIPVFILTGHWGNRMTERKNRESLQAKQKKFSDGLRSVGKQYIYTGPINDAEAEARRTTIKETVLRLSKEIFKQNYPDIPSFRPEDTIYPELPCKWCKRNLIACSGSKGECKTCSLPLDLWLGSQGTE